MSENARYISFISNPQFWATIKAIHNHMLAEKVDDWGYKKITRLGEILEGKYSDHLTPQHKQDEIDFTNKLASFIRQIGNTQSSTGTITDIEHMTYVLNQSQIDDSVLSPTEKEFVTSLNKFIEAKINCAVQQTVNSLKIVKEE